MANRSGKGWDLKNSTWKKLGKMSAKSSLNRANYHMSKAKRGFEQSDKIGGQIGAGIKKDAMKRAHWSKILYANGKKKQAYNRSNAGMRKMFK